MGHSSEHPIHGGDIDRRYVEWFAQEETVRVIVIPLPPPAQNNLKYRRAVADEDPSPHC